MSPAWKRIHESLGDYYGVPLAGRIQFLWLREKKATSVGFSWLKTIASNLRYCASQQCRYTTPTSDGSPDCTGWTVTSIRPQSPEAGPRPTPLTSHSLRHTTTESLYHEAYGRTHTVYIVQSLWYSNMSSLIPRNVVSAKTDVRPGQEAFKVAVSKSKQHPTYRHCRHYIVRWDVQKSTS